jgi:hypothetical protein
MFVIGSAAAPGFGSGARSLAQYSANAIAPIKFDHALICVSDLAPMQQGLAAVGLQADYGGHHGHATTQMAQLGFPDGTYIGVEAPVDASVETGTPQSALMEANAGPCGWSVTSSDLKAESLVWASRSGCRNLAAGTAPMGRWLNGAVHRSDPGRRGQIYLF